MDGILDLFKGFVGQSGNTGLDKWLPIVLALGGGALAASQGSNQRPSGYQGGIPRYTATRQPVGLPPVSPGTGGAMGRRYFTDTQFTPQQLASGGIAALAPRNGYYLGGSTDGMADEIPARIDGQDEAALSDGEFVIPADVVSGLGNGNSDAGAKKLYEMMARVRVARTGTPEQGRRINPDKLMPR